MGYVFTESDAMQYEQWLADEQNRAVLELETGLMKSMLRPLIGESLLDIGCGTGESIRPYLGKGINLTGIDPSIHMLEVAREKIGHRVDFHRGYAENLPFEDNAFNHASLFLTLEFVEDPEQAIAEACRVAKDSVFIGILNKHSAIVTKKRIMALLRGSIFKHARFFDIVQVRQMIFKSTGRVPVSWKTVLQVPGTPRNLTYRIEAGGYLHKIPFGGFAGIKAIPIPRLRAIPLALKSRVAKNVAAGRTAVSCAEYCEKNQKRQE